MSSNEGMWHLNSCTHTLMQMNGWLPNTLFKLSLRGTSSQFWRAQKLLCAKFFKVSLPSLQFWPYKCMSKITIIKFFRYKVLQWLHIKHYMSHPNVFYTQNNNLGKCFSKYLIYSYILCSQKYVLWFSWQFFFVIYF